MFMLPTALPSTRRTRRRSRGFTLLELLAVVAILAMLAGGVVALIDRTEQDVQTKVAQSEIVEIKNAIRRFYQDTGYLPKSGPFALTDDFPPGFIDPNDDTHWPSYAPTSAAERIAWFRSPANLYQLFAPPLLGPANSTHTLAGWNPDSRRGWNGPYVSHHGNWAVSIGEALNEGGSPTAGNVHVVPAVADPHAASPVGAYLTWWDLNSGTLVPARWGRPYLLIVDAAPQNRFDARIVGMGLDGTLGTDDDVVVWIFR
jgi:prepilin-type N-terminal cleavage/methylation domain-containing protein